ncbi:uncharacterized protein LOC131192822 [Ahaetulla prasina]|uniref:uncharacterized protein LOC131192822 n=1 Tax=Ahaetulla prasina TaxID=499056 RepID=UPI002649617D|nr:uncharacterized protein LOC131192822 [Ahaetulla prasina]
MPNADAADAGADHQARPPLEKKRSSRPHPRPSGALLTSLGWGDTLSPERGTQDLHRVPPGSSQPKGLTATDGNGINAATVHLATGPSQAAGASRENRCQRKNTPGASPEARAGDPRSPKGPPSRPEKACHHCRSCQRRRSPDRWTRSAPPGKIAAGEDRSRAPPEAARSPPRITWLRRQSFTGTQGLKRVPPGLDWSKEAHRRISQSVA